MNRASNATASAVGGRGGRFAPGRLALLLFLLAPGTGLAAEADLLPAAVDAADRAAIALCLRDSGGLPRSCIGAVAVTCSARQGSADRAETQITCSRREAAVWRERLDMAVALTAGQLDGGPRSRLAAVQRSWESYVAQKCALLGELSPPARSGVMQAACELREVALRAIDVERLAQTARQSATAPRRPELQR